MALDAVLFDIDGTLLNTNGIHVEAWRLALDSQGYRLGRDRIEAEIGKGGDKLVPALLGQEVEARDGDTRYDMQAARRAGVIGLAVLTGYHSRQSLLGSGARAVYANAAELLQKLDDALRRASPGTLHATPEVLEGLMRAALAQARLAYETGQPPIGCVLADGHGQVVAGGHNQINQLHDCTAHAEMVTLRSYPIPAGARDYILVSTLEPCVMCTGAAMEIGIDMIVFGLPAPADSGSERVTPPQSVESQMPRIIGRVLDQPSRALFERFAHTATDPLQRAFAEQLLALTS